MNKSSKENNPLLYYKKKKMMQVLNVKIWLKINKLDIIIKIIDNDF